MKSTPDKLAKHRENLTADWQKIKNAFSDTYEDVSELADDTIHDSLDNIKQQTSEMQQSVTAYTEKNPLPALGIAMLIGIVIGCWIKR